ncbi:LysR family transcriptional regulator [Kaistia algarum]|uniref:LysR family transcriptional regulator n=1 Tax=Kaistia algarum TaxID=2083279 RepID=UPI000CE874C6|nr:LysR family transcriptional regulator [Kaistia algarum]MCX5516146.1 LysR family transcriptional regulator [Kaistia algarum]PPE78220.1 LysR family transcriptional regulator [Kaistia algarum]
MVRPHLPLNALKAFEASARHLSFTRAAIELAVTQAAVSHQVKSLEERLGSTLFRRLPRGLALTDEGQALLPALRDSFDRIAAVLEQFEDGHVREVLNVGVVGTFAIGWLIERLPAFKLAHPFIDLRLSTNNNRVDIAAEGLDFAIRFGDGAWHSTEADRLFAAPLSVLCLPEIAERLSQPPDLYGETLLRSYRADEWPTWFATAGIAAPAVKGPIFDSSRTMVEAAILGAGVALAPPLMFQRQLAGGLIQQPFEIFVTHGCYWLTWLKSSTLTPAMRSFQAWILAASLPYSKGNG